MDPSFMKLFEEDEDETMHSGADVEALTAALNRDIEGSTSMALPSGPDSNMNQTEPFCSQAVHQTSSCSVSQWRTLSQDDNTSLQSHQGENSAQQFEQNLAEVEPKQHVITSGKQQHIDPTRELNSLPLQQNQPQIGPQRELLEQVPFQFSEAAGTQLSQKNSVILEEQDRMHSLNGEPQYSAVPNNQQRLKVAEQACNPGSRSTQVPFALLLPVIVPRLDKDRAMQLRTLYAKLKKNEIPKDGFVRHMRGIVGDQMLKFAVMELHEQVRTGSNYPPVENPVQKSREGEYQSDSHGGVFSQEREHSAVSMQGFNKQQQHMHVSHTSFPIYSNTSGNYHTYSGTSVNISAPSLKPQAHDPQMRQAPLRLVSTQLGGSTNAMTMPKFERQTSVTDPRRVQSGSSHLANSLAIQRDSVPWQSATSKEQNGGVLSPLPHVKQEPTDQANELIYRSHLSTSQGALKDDSLEKQPSRMSFSSTMASVPFNPVSSSMMQGGRLSSAASPSGINLRAPLKKPFVVQKRPPEAIGPSPSLPSKKQKVSGILDQSIEQLNDVTAVSGVDIREEEEQLLSGSKDDSRVSEASRRVVQEEEERLILQKLPLQKVLENITSKCGVRSVGPDVERCLSLCVEERLRGLICSLIRLSKQRLDVEMSRHRTFVTSDVRQQILVMNQKAREEWEKKQAELERLQKPCHPTGDTGSEGDKEKDEGRAKAPKVNKEEDDKMRTTAANVAARAAVGGDDMLSKWQLMAEQARQKRGGMDSSSGSQAANDVGSKNSLAAGKNTRDGQESGARGSAAASFGAVKRFRRGQEAAPHDDRTICVKDVIAALERDPNLSKSTLLYRLYEKKSCLDL